MPHKTVTPWHPQRNTRGALALIAGAFALCAAAEALPCSSVAGTFIEDVYMRPMFAWGWPLLWFCTMPAGFLYVARCTIGRKTPDIFIGLKGSHQTINRTMMIATPLFFLAPWFVLDSGCLEDPPSTFSWEVVKYNYLLWCLPAVLGLQYSFVYQPRTSMIVLKAAYIKQWKLFEWTVVTVVAFVIVGFASAIGYLMWDAGRLWAYIGAFLSVVSLIGLTGWCLKETHYLHLHHCSAFGLLIPFTGVDHPIGALAQGLLTGIMLEGSTRFGWETIFYRRPGRPAPKPNAPTNPSSKEAKAAHVAAAAPTQGSGQPGHAPTRAQAQAAFARLNLGDGGPSTEPMISPEERGEGSPSELAGAGAAGAVAESG